MYCPVPLAIRFFPAWLITVSLPDPKTMRLRPPPVMIVSLQVPCLEAPALAPDDGVVTVAAYERLVAFSAASTGEVSSTHQNRSQGHCP